MTCRARSGTSGRRISSDGSALAAGESRPRRALYRAAPRLVQDAFISRVRAIARLATPETEGVAINLWRCSPLRPKMRSSEVTAMLSRALISICLGVSLASCAGTPLTSETAKSPVAAGAVPSQAPGCPRSSNSPTPAPALNCTGPSSVYTRTNIDRTGEATVGGALQNLSTTLTVHGNP